MPYLSTAHSWLTQSTLLLQARPSTTRISTKYTIEPPANPSLSPKARKVKLRSTSTTAEPSSDPPAPRLPTQAPEPTRAILQLKTYDYVSGVSLKYKTNKAAEVGRLIQILGRLARPMAGLPVTKEEVVEGGVGGDGSGVATPVGEALINKPVQIAGGGAGGASGGGKKKKVKGKK